MKKQANEQLVTIIQQRIRERMQDLRISQAELAQDADVSRSGLNEALKKNRIPGCDFLMKIACRLGVTVDYLLGGELRANESLPGDREIMDISTSLSALSPADKAKVKELIDSLRGKDSDKPKS